MKCPQTMKIIFVMALALWQYTVAAAYKVVYAVNAGGDAHIDRFDIRYEADSQKLGVASDFGKNLMIIGRVAHQTDEILYQTERYHTSTFGYDLPAKEGDGEYVLILKFCEVYFNQPNQKVFDVVLNGEHTVVMDLDIFAQVGKGVAHDEYVYFTISRGRLFYKEEESEIRGDKIRVEFIKGYRDNPKINAIVLLKGNLANIPKLPPLDVELAQDPIPDVADIDDSIDNFVERPAAQQRQQQQSDSTTKGSRKTSGPKVEDPYALDDSSFMLPVFIAIGAFIPLLFCLCKL